MKRAWVCAVAGGLLHLFASVAAFLWHYKLAFDHFDGRPVARWALWLSAVAQDGLWLPLARPLYALGGWPGWLGWLPLVLNSAFCATVCAWLWRWHLRRRGCQS